MFTTLSTSRSIWVLLTVWTAAARSTRVVEIHAVPISAISTSSATTRIRTEPRVLRRELRERVGGMCLLFIVHPPSIGGGDQTSPRGEASGQVDHVFVRLGLV